MIRHSVVFILQQFIQPGERQSFFEAAAKLSAIPGVKDFELLKQVSTKNNFDYGIAMKFDTESEYEQYNSHPDHQLFLEKYWFTCVKEFMEIDFTILDQ
jgi:heme-degrading monooxygenase HmoA